MIVDTSYYPIWTEQSDLTENGYAISYTLKNLYDSQTSEMVFGEQMNNTNVYGYVDENSLLTQISSGTFASSVSTTKSDVYRANLRLFWSFQSGQEVETKTGFDLISDANNTHFTESSGYPAGNNGYASYWLVPFVRLRYDQLCLYVRFRVGFINKLTGAFSTGVYTLDEITQYYGQDLLDNGYTNNENEDIVRFIGGVVLQASLRTTNPTALRYIYPYVEFNYNGNVYFGKPFENALDRHSGYYFNNYLTYYSNGVYVSSNGNLPTANANYTLTEFCYGEDFCFGFSGDNEIDYSTFQYNECKIFDHIIVVKYPRNEYYSIGKFFNYEECLNIVSSLGLYFTFDANSCVSSTLGQSITDNNIYLGKMYEDGRCDGTYTRGTATKSEPQAQTGVYILTDRETDRTIDVIPVDTTEPFKPDSDPDSDKQIKPANVEGVSMSIQKNRRLTSATNFISLYNITPDQLSTLGSVLWHSIADYDPSSLDAQGNLIHNFYVQLGQDVTGTFDTSAILNYFISARIYPFAVGTLPNLSVASGTDIFIGNGKVGIPIGSTVRLMTSTIGLIDAGVVSAQPITPYNDFRDFYNTTVTAFLPYCGTVELNPAEVMNKTLHCYYAVDFYTGECTAYILVEGDIEYIVAVANGVMGVQIPLSATSQTQLEARHTMDGIDNARLISAFMRDVINTGMSIKDRDIKGLFGEGGSVHGLVNDVMQGLALDAQRQSRSGVSAPYLSGGNNGTSFFMPDSAYLQIRRGTYTRPKNYGHTVGYPNTESSKLSYHSGFTICHNVDVSGLTCTVEEQEEIKALLESGIYI